MPNRRVTAAVVILAAVFAVSATAQSPYLVTDLNTATVTPGSSDPTMFQAFGDTLFFSATTAESGRELWKYSGGAASMVRDINFFSTSTTDYLADIGGGVKLFGRWTNNYSHELWRTDGTFAGTTVVKNIRPDGNSMMGGSRAVFHGRLYFVANDGVHGTEPWLSDGTEGGTQMLLDLEGTSASSTITLMAIFDDRLLIFGNDALWTSDGTAAGTTRITTVGNVRNFSRIGSTLYFTARNAASGRELWKSDGTAAGTQMVADIAPGAASGLLEFSFLTAVGSTLYFTAAADERGADLWKTDGTAAGTQFVKTLVDDAWVEAVGVTLAGGFCIRADGMLWRSDGTEAGTVALETTGVTHIAPAFNLVYYFRTAGTLSELWATDGTTKTLVKTLPSAAFWLTWTGGKLYFSAWEEQYGTEPWVCEDGTGATTHRLANVNPDLKASASPNNLTSAGNLLFFGANDGFTTGDVFRSDGTANGTFRVSTLPGATNTPTPAPLLGWNGAAFFRRNGFELWRSDGTLAGTAVLQNIAHGGTDLAKFFGGSRYLFFTSGGSQRLWRTDGTVSGTMAVGSELPSFETIEVPSSFAELAGRVYVSGYHSTSGIWVTDGDSDTTRRIYSAPDSTGIGNLTAAAGALFFVKDTATTGLELWRTDGTPGSASLVLDIAPGNASSIPGTPQFAAAGRYLYFVANDGTRGEELWRTDGTAAGTLLLADIAAGAGSSKPSSLTAAGALLYFVADDGAHGAELWRTDGTPVGTVMVSDLKPGSGSSAPRSLAFADGTLWFNANDGVAGEELWRLAGGIPSMVADLAPGSASSSPASLVQVGQQLFFTAYTAAFGRELWAVALTQSLLAIDDARIVEGTGGTRTLRFTVTRSGNTSGAASVAFATSNGTAVSDDYVARTGTLSFTAGQTSQFLDTTVNADTIIEGSESFFVTLSSPSGALLVRDVGTGIIDDDDHRVDLSITAVLSITTRRFRVTNLGPSLATDVRLRFSESPRKMQSLTVSAATANVSCATQDNPITCILDSIAPGATIDLTVEPYGAAGFTDVASPPGSTVTASISAAEIENNPADNLVSNMISEEGMLMLPPFLTSGTSATALFRLQYTSGNQPSNVALTSSSALVTVTPSSRVLPANLRESSFSLAAGAGTGKVTLKLQPFGWPSAALTVPVVAPGSMPKLDVAIVATGSHVIYGDAATVAVEVAARRHDGTRPGGTVSLLDESLNVIAQQTIDGAAKTTFTRANLQPGRRTYFVRYEGDANFNSLSGAQALVDVDPWPAVIDVTVPPMICAGTTHQVTIVVRTSATTNAPTGSVDVSVPGGPVTTLALTPTGTPGQSRAVWSRQFSAGESAVSVTYVPTGTFGSTNGAGQFRCSVCAPLAVNATATSTTAVAVTWSAVAGADHYQLLRLTSRSNWSVAVTTAALGANDTDLTPMRSYLYTVIAFDATSNIIGYGAPDIATTMAFTDDPLIAGVTPIRATHLQQLRIGANALRWFGIAADVTAVTPVPVGGAIRASDLTALRDELNTLRLGLGLPAFAFTDPTLTSATRIKAVHVDELRRAVK